MKTEQVTIRLRGHWSIMPYVSDDTKGYTAFSRKEYAKPFSRARAAKLIRHWRNQGRYYRMITELAPHHGQAE